MVPGIVRRKRLLQVLMGGLWAGLTLLPLAAHADLGVSKTRASGFADPKFVGDTDGFLIRLTNSFSSGDISDVRFTDTMPEGFRVAGAGVVSAECRDGTGAVTGSQSSGNFPGTLTAPLGSNTIALSDGVIPSMNGGSEAGHCDIVVQVTSLSGSGTNVIPAGTVQGVHNSNQVVNADPAQQSLNFNSLPAPSISKSFSPTSIVKDNQPTRLSMVITNNSTQPLPLNGAGDSTPFGIRDRLGDFFLRVASDPDVGIDCGATPPTFAPAAGATEIRAVGGIIAPNSSCTLSVMVVADGSDSAYSTSVNNVINRSTDFANRRGLVPPSDASASLTVTAPLRVEKIFVPATVAKGQEAMLRITLTNASPLSSMVLGGFRDIIDGGAGLLTITAQPTATCSGGSSLTGLSGVGTSTLQMTGGTLADGGNCVITVPYTADLAVAGAPQSFTNTIAPGAVTVDLPKGVVSQGVSASVTVVDQFLVEKTSRPAVAAPGNPVRFVVTTRNYSTSLQTGVALTDNLPNGMLLLGSPAPALSGTGCSALSVGGTASSPVFTFNMPAGTAGGSANCAVTFWAMVPANAPAGAIVNQIPAGGVCTPGNICNHTPSNASDASFTVRSSALAVEKSFDASSKPEGTAATMTIELVNLSARPLTSVSLTDNLPLGSDGTPMLVASPNNASSTCGGTITAVPGSNQVILTGASVPARAGGGLDDAGRCRLRVNVVGAAGQYDNRVIASGTQTFADNSTAQLTSPEAKATINFLSALSGTKSFTPNRIQPGGRSTVTLTLSNSQAGVLNDVSITDDLPAGMTVANPANAYSTCAGAPVISAAPGAALVSLSGAQLAGNSSCALLFDVTGTGGGNWLNSIAPGQLTAAGGVQNVASFGATLQNASGGAVTVGVNHASASVAAPGAVTQLTLTLFNSGGLDLTNLSLSNFFTDTGLAGGTPTGERISSVPNAVTNCSGGVVSASPNGTSYTLSGVDLAVGQSCSVTVDVTMTTTGTVIAVVPVGAITTAQGVSNTVSPSTSLQTSTGLGVTKQFTPSVVAPNERSRLRITFYNPTSQPINDLALTDSYPSGLVNASPANALTTCQGTVGTAAGQVSISGGNIAAGTSNAPASCYVEVDVLSTTQGDYLNTIPAGSISATTGGSPISNNEPTSDTLRVKAPIIVHKAIATRTLDAGDPVGFVTGTASGNAGTPYTLSIRLDNPNAAPLTGLSYLDSLPSGLVVAPVPAIANSCGGSVAAAPSATSVRLAGGTLAANGSCVVSVAVLSNIAGTYTNTIPAGGVSSFESVSNSEPTRARLVISSPPTVTKQFAPAVIAQNGVSRLTIYINNPNASAMTLTAALTDNLPDAPGQVRVAASPNLGGSCPAGNVTANAAATFVRLASGTVVPAGGCTIEVDVTASTSGEHTNVIPAGELRTDLGNNPEPAYAPLTVSTQGFISGRVYLDNNQDGAFQAGSDTPLGGVPIELRTGSSCAAGTPVSGINGLLNPINTDAAGNYLFAGLPAGTYSVCQANQPAGTLNAPPVAGSITPSNGSSGTPGSAGNASETSSQIQGIVLNGDGAGGEISGSQRNDFPEVAPASLSGAVFIDLNNDGIRQGGDSGLAGVVINLSGIDWQNRPVTATTTTDASGNYRFSGLQPGTYTVTEPSQPAGTANGLTVAGNSAGAVPSVTAPGVVPSAISGITLTSGYASQENNFAEIVTGRSIYGRIFHDRDTDGAPSSGDTGLGGETVQLSGQDINGNPINLSTVTANDGTFSFVGLPPGVYDLLQPNQPGGLLNGSTSAGSAGGLVSEGPSRISNIDLTTTMLSVDNWFAEVSIPGLSGTVWFDTNHDRVLDPGETRLAGWIVELVQGGAVVASTQSDANGAYAFSDLTPGSGYEVRFRHPETGTLFGRPVPNEQGLAHTPGTAGPGNPAGADNRDGTLSNITITAGRNVVEQSLPIDPAGVVYDAISRQPVRGAVVNISGPAGFTAAQVLGGALQQTTGADGLYQFLLLSTAPAGTYTLTVTAPAGYMQGPSALIPACSNTLQVTAIPDPALVQTSNQAPADAVALHDAATCPATSAGLGGNNGTTQYYFSFVLGAGSADVVNNHIPLDPLLGGAIVMTKNTAKVNVTRGELVPYVLTARNTLSTTLVGIAIEDQMPPGFKYIKHSAQIDGVPVEPLVEGRLLRWPERTLNGGQLVTIKLLLVVGSGVGFNEYINQTWAMNLAAAARVSNVATASVRVVADPTFDCSDLIGKVFDDKNRNGYQDEGEPGIPGVRVATPKGWLVTTDEHGRYHIACADVPSELRGSNFIVKVDERSLPSGYRIITENPRVVRMTQGRLVKANFGASIHRVVRLDLGSDAFGTGNQLTEQYQSRLDDVLKLLYAEPSILRIAYRMPVDGEISDARARVAYVKDWIKEHWEPHDCCYDLQLEEEIVPATDSVEVIR